MADKKEELKSGNFLGWLISITLFFLVACIVTWVLASKPHVYVIDKVNEKLVVDEDWYSVREDYVFGIPNIVARWFGWQAPKSITVNGSEITIAGVLNDFGDIMIINRTKNIIYHKTLHYSLNSKRLEGIKDVITPIAIDTGMVLEDSSFGYIVNFGCSDKPPSRISIDTYSAEEIITLAWVTEKAPQECK